MRRRTIARDPMLNEILLDKARTKALFRSGTNENVKNGGILRDLAELYRDDRQYFEQMFPTIIAYVETYIDEHSNKYKPGFIKMPIGFKSPKRDLEIKVEFGEPKKRKYKETVTVTEVDMGKKKGNKSLW